MVKSVGFYKMKQMQIVDAYNKIVEYTALSNIFNINKPTRWNANKKYNDTHCVKKKLRTDRKHLISERIKRKMLDMPQTIFI